MKNLSDLFSSLNTILNHLQYKYIGSILQNQNDINKILDLLSDDDSKDLYCRELIFCILSNFLIPSLCPELTGMPTYQHWNKCIARMESNSSLLDLYADFSDKASLIRSLTSTFVLKPYDYNSIVNVRNGDVCLDLGSYIGDTAIYMVQCGAKEVYSFETDPNNISVLENVINTSPLYSNIKPIHAGVSSSYGTLFFVPCKENPAAGKLHKKLPASSNYISVPSITLDSFCSDNDIRPDFIKMDIEGEELDAIRGSQLILKEFRPKFAISIYHIWQHRWQIPILLSSLCHDYKFYMKKTRPNCDLVFFGIPKERLAC